MTPVVLVFQAVRQPPDQLAAPAQQTQRGVPGEERTSARRLHSAFRQRPSQGTPAAAPHPLAVWLRPALTPLFLVFQVKELLWNGDSTVLGVWLEDVTAEGGGGGSSYSELRGNRSFSCKPEVVLRPRFCLQSSSGRWGTTTGTSSRAWTLAETPRRLRPLCAGIQSAPYGSTW